MQLFVKLIEQNDLIKYLEDKNRDTLDWQIKAARGECGWICPDCSCGFKDGMPDECLHGHSKCTDLIRRDKELYADN